MNRGRGGLPQRCVVLPAFVGFVLMLLGHGAMTQQSVVERCRATGSDAERIACLEAAILERENSREPTAQTQLDPPSLKLEAAPADDPETATSTPESRPTGIGASQVIARQQTPEERAESLEEAHGLRVQGYDTVPFEKLVVTLENGQVWKQINGDNQEIRVNLDRNQTVDITESSLGGYKLRLNEMRRTLRVERVK